VAERKQFRDNPSEETVSPQGIARSASTRVNTSFELPANPTPPPTAELPPPMPRPIVKDELPKIVPPKMTPAKIRASDEMVMNAGAEKLLEYLPDDAKELVLEYRASQDVPLWQVIGGYVMRCRDNGEMFAGNILPDWTDMIAPNAVRACGTCGDPMKPQLQGQTFCCNFCASGKRSTLGHNETCALTHEKV